MFSGRHFFALFNKQTIFDFSSHKCTHMDVVIITGSNGLVGSEAARFYAAKDFLVVGIDNDMRAEFFGPAASTKTQRAKLEQELGSKYVHLDCDIRDAEKLNAIFSEFGKYTKLVIHCCSQPSHDKAASIPHIDFAVNATGTLNMLDATMTHCQDAVFIFTSTNKVYGDNPNFLPFVECGKRWEIDTSELANHPEKYRCVSLNGINEQMSIDNTTHSLFGVSKTAADLLCQEYGRYFGLKTGIFRIGCITGENHAGCELHGFLSYLVKCAIQGKPYTIFGYEGKQVRDNIHSYDLVSAFHEFYLNPKKGEVYNIGGSRQSNISVLEAIDEIERQSGKRLNYTISKDNRIGDHMWYISDVAKFSNDYPNWRYKYSMQEIISKIIESNI